MRESDHSHHLIQNVIVIPGDRDGPVSDAVFDETIGAMGNVDMLLRTLRPLGFYEV